MSQLYRALFPKLDEDPELDRTGREIEYIHNRGADGIGPFKVGYIYTDTKEYPPEWVDKRKWNMPPLTHQKAKELNLKLRVFDIVKNEWLILNVCDIVSDCGGTPPLPICSEHWQNVHRELVESVDQKVRNSLECMDYQSYLTYGAYHVAMCAIGPLIGQCFNKTTLSHKKTDLHKELLEVEKY